MRYQKLTPRAVYRQQESQRIKDSCSLAQKFRELKALVVELAYFTPEGQSRNGQIKYTVNPEHAKSVFRFDCPNPECIRGDFDLSEALARAVVGLQASVTGEIRCEGWMSKTTIDRIHCRNLLRYKFSLEYGVASAADLVPELEVCRPQDALG